MSDMITKQLVHEKTVLFDRVNMIEKDLTQARITIDILIKKQEEDRYAIKELVTACNMLRLRVENLEKHVDKVFHP